MSSVELVRGMVSLGMPDAKMCELLLISVVLFLQFRFAAVISAMS